MNTVSLLAKCLQLLAVGRYSAHMRFELPSDLNKSLTDIGHTAVGFATLAAKRANDARLDTNVRFKPQVVQVRKRALQVVETLQTARLRVESAVEPLLDRAVDRLPENVQDTVGEIRKSRVEFAAKAHDGVVKVIKFATTVPVVPMAKTTTKPAAAGAATITKAVRTAKSAADSAAKSATKSVRTATAKPVAKATRVARVAKPKAVKAARVAKSTAVKATKAPRTAKPTAIKAARTTKAPRVAKTTTRRVNAA